MTKATPASVAVTNNERAIPSAPILNRTSTMYRAFLVVHRWLALVVAVFLVVIALSGSLLIFEAPLRDASAARVKPSGGVLPLDRLVARAQAASNAGAPMMLSVGDAPDLAYGLLFLPGSSGGAPKELEIDPYTGAVLPDPPPPGLVYRFIRGAHMLHTRLMGGRTGSTIVAGVTILTLFVVLTGLVTWWRDKFWRVHTQGSWKRVNFDLHHSLGVFSAILLLLLAATGIWVHFDQIDGWMKRLNPSPAAAPPMQPSAAPGMPVASFGRLADAARTAVPGAALMLIQVPPGPKAPAMAQLKYPEDHTPAGRSRVFLDKYRGTVLLAMSTRTAEPGQHLIDIKRALHTGDIYGWPTRIVWALACIVLAAQTVTGVLMWWNAKRRLL